MADAIAVKVIKQSMNEGWDNARTPLSAAFAPEFAGEVGAIDPGTPKGNGLYDNGTFDADGLDACTNKINLQKAAIK